MGNEWTIETLKVMSKYSAKNADCLGVKEEPYWDFIEVDNFICPILHNQINLSNNIFHNLSDCGNENIEKFSVTEDMTRNSLLVINSSIEEKVHLRDEFDISDERKDYNTFKNHRRNNKTPITNISEEISDRDVRIDELSKKKKRNIQ